jgi:hypothetical protein
MTSDGKLINAALFAYVNNIQNHMEDDTFKHILQDKQFHLQIKGTAVVIQLVSRDHVCRFENGSQIAE